MLAFFLAFVLTVSAGMYFYFRLRRHSPGQAQINSHPYSLLIQQLRDNRPLTRCELSPKRIVLGVRNEDDQESFVLNEVNDKFMLVWTLESKLYGKRGKEWAFASTAQQAAIVEQVRRDIAEYKGNLHRDR